MRNYYIFVVVLGIFSLNVIFIGFSIVGSPLEQKAINLDNQRLTDFSDIHTKILDYYSSKKKLPEKLNVLPNDTSGKDKKHFLKDPESNDEYDYKTEGQYKYKLCTVFSTDTRKDDETDKNYYSSSYYYDLSKDAKNIKHKKGYDCIEVELSDYYKNLYTTPTPILQDHLMIIHPQYNEKLCLGQEYTITWEAEPTVKRAGLYLVTPTEVKKTFDNPWLSSYEPPVGEPINASDPQSRLRGSFKWIVGEVEGDETATILHVPPGHGYQIGVVTSPGSTSDVATSYNFDIVNCASGSVKSTP